MWYTLLHFLLLLLFWCFVYMSQFDKTATTEGWQLRANANGYAAWWWRSGDNGRMTFAFRNEIGAVESGEWEEKC